MKYWLTMLMVSMLFVLSACSGEEKVAKEGEETGGNSKEQTITFLQPGLDQPNQKEPVEKMIKRFEEENPGIKVELQSVGWGEAYQKLVTGFSSGESPDVFYAGTRWMPAFAQMGGIMPLDEYAEDKMKEYHDGLQENVKFQDKIYAIPRAFSARSLIYRSDLIEEPPTTWDELVETAKKVQSENKGMYGLGIAGAKHVSTTDQYFNYLFQNNGEVFNAKGEVVLDSPEAIEALTFYRDLYTKHKVVPNPIEYNREQLPILFKEGKIAMFVIGPWAKSMMGLEPDNDSTPFKTALLPKGEKMANVLVSDSLMVSAKTENPEAAWKLIEFMTSAEEQLAYDKEHGLVPIQKAEAEDPFFNEDPYFSTFVEMVQYGEPQPKPTAWEPFQDIISEAVQKAMNNEDPKKALKEAVKEIKDQKLEPK
ncbi:sugar ABC transporter substrate-binding protein [Mesobacillus subterraneus]|uniref:ABC transporter substrate-binding protein n=1 Tax=Mesobacillus subterraneus TaxID=285983 RepID=UPI00203B20E9|nr:sugar ABC transporter substrate-binding protein [Mesobacillus subterraneus]MCM3685837.1 sugar ABC transporter substrate-binding protein [Mesobacillus subterraneus]